MQYVPYSISYDNTFVISRRGLGVVAHIMNCAFVFFLFVIYLFYDIVYSFVTMPCDMPDAKAFEKPNSKLMLFFVHRNTKQPDISQCASNYRKHIKNIRGFHKATQPMQ